MQRPVEPRLFASSYAQPDESVEDFGLAQWQVCPEQPDRTGRAGALILTTHRVAHWSDRERSADLLLPRASVSLEVGRKIFPRLREARIRVLDEPGEKTAVFAVGKSFASRLIDAQHTLGNASQPQAAVLSARGSWMPVVNRASGGPGVFSVRDGEPSFVTDSGMRHSIAWESFVSWSARDGQIFVTLAPPVGARLRFQADDIEPWRRVVLEHHVAEASAPTTN